MTDPEDKTKPCSFCGQPLGPDELCMDKWCPGADELEDEELEELDDEEDSDA